MLRMQDGRPVIVSEAVMRPNHCALNPHVTRDPDGFIDTGTKLPGFEPRVYIAMQSARALVRDLGWPTPEAHTDLQDRIAALEAERDQLKAAVAERDEQLAAVSVLRHGGYTATSEPAAPEAAPAAAPALVTAGAPPVQDELPPASPAPRRPRQGNTTTRPPRRPRATSKPDAS